MRIIASNHFLKFKKKSPKKLQFAIDGHVKKLIEDPEIGKQKKGDLKGVRVHKFTYGQQLLILSYEVSENVLRLYTIGSHENFYKKLKKYL